MSENILVLGATQGIGLEITRYHLKKKNKVVATYRDVSDLESLKELQYQYRDLSLCKIDVYDEKSFTDLFNFVKSNFESCDKIFNCIGFLYSRDYPEKKILDLKEGFLSKSFSINTLPTLFLAKTFFYYLKKNKVRICILSAKVGSIEDNKMGGWYSYRISKAALNMAVKNIACEFSRFNKDFLIIAMHPGTTDTRLSAPFIDQARKRYKVHTAEETAKNIISVFNKCETKDNGKFLSWTGEEIPW